MALPTYFAEENRVLYGIPMKGLPRSIICEVPSYYPDRAAVIARALNAHEISYGAIDWPAASQPPKPADQKEG